LSSCGGYIRPSFNGVVGSYGNPESSCSTSIKSLATNAKASSAELHGGAAASTAGLAGFMRRDFERLAHHPQ
jgi:hypothetical protein